MARDHLVGRGVGDLDSEELLFVNSDGEGLDYSNWYHRVWVPATFAIKRAGLQFHDLRRTNATALVQEGVDVKTAQERLGHSDPRLTIGLYAQVIKAGERDAADRLGDAFVQVNPLLFVQRARWTRDGTPDKRNRAPRKVP